MKTVQSKILGISKVLVPAALIISAPFAALADVSASTDVNANVQVGTPAVIMSSDPKPEPADHASSTLKVRVGASVSVTNQKDRADKEIERRIQNLNELSARINEMKNVTTSEKTSLQASITTEITNLNSLKATIDAATDATTVKTDLQSITKDYRIYMLVIPQGRIIASADRIETIVADMQALAPKLQARITEAQTAGKDVTAANSAYADMQAKLTDANTQATAAVNAVANLTPDQGNTSTESSNNAALKDAAAKIKAATADLKAVRVDVTTITKAVKGTGSATASTTASASAESH